MSFVDYTTEGHVVFERKPGDFRLVLCNPDGDLKPTA